MNRRTLGTSLEVSAQGLGCMGMSQSYGQADLAESEATLLKALDLGITFFDTADAYGAGHNEELVGRVLKPHRDQVQLATKFAIVPGKDGKPMGVQCDPAYVKQACEASLTRLGLDHIDLYYMHRLDPDVPIEDTVGAMSELVSEGKVKHLGLCEISSKTIRRAHAVHPISAVQSEYSLWTRDVEEHVLPVCAELGIGFVPFSPLGRGFLTGALSKDDLGKGDMRNMLPRFSDDNFDKNRALVSAVEALAADKGVKAGQIALAWVMSQSDGIVPIPGTKRRKYLEENAAADAVDLTTDDMAKLDAIFGGDAVTGERYPQAIMDTVEKD
ncbi:aldo/keto reductase [Pyruvatibacter sp. HU-CL02332]|uniref:aldo/keto reductase n=1 Tax=Pyruvatibacter sp. HU-CL02332 TaxID=3127650 RepID=UPI003105B352